MLENKFRDYYRIEHELPQASTHCPRNITETLNMFELFLNFGSEFDYKRSEIFVCIAAFIMQIRFIYICIQVIVRKQDLRDIGSTLFIVMTLMDVFVYNFYFI